MPKSNQQAGFSLLELTIVVILVVMLFLFVADRLLPLRGDAESAQVASVIGSLRSALGLEVASRIVEHGPQSVTDLQGSNPMALLQDWPENYLGERSAANNGEIPRGAWYFDETSGELHYRVRFPQYLAGEPDSPVELRWRVRLQFDDRDGDGRFDAETETLRGVRLARLDEHRWPGDVSTRAEGLASNSQ